MRLGLVEINSTSTLMSLESFGASAETNVTPIVFYFTNMCNAHTMRTWRFPMKSRQSNQARKRPVNLTLNEELVTQAKGMTNNLSGVVEQLLADYVMKQNSARQEKAHHADVAAQAWNTFNECSGSFADEHSTL